MCVCVCVCKARRPNISLPSEGYRWAEEELHRQSTNEQVASLAHVGAAPVEAATEAVASVQGDVKSMFTQANTVRETVGAPADDSNLRSASQSVSSSEKSKQRIDDEDAKVRDFELLELKTLLIIQMILVCAPGCG